MADKFQICNRLQGLSWKHHDTAASIKQIATDADGTLCLSSQFELCRRLQVLSYAHHVEVASIKQIEDAFEMSIRIDNLSHRHHREVASINLTGTTGCRETAETAQCRSLNL